MEQSRKERVAELTEKLEQGVKEIFTSGRFDEYLKTMSKFHHYSYGNCMLIFSQFPGASQVAGFQTWKRDFDRHVKKGAVGIKILAPVPLKVLDEQEQEDGEDKAQLTLTLFKPVTVFDVSQTEGKELPSLGVDELSGDVPDFTKIYHRLEKLSPVPIEQKDFSPPSVKGYYSFSENQIVVRPGMSQTQTLKTLVHEIAHAKLRTQDEDEKKRRGEREVEAESVAYVVCQHFGIDTSDYSFGYVAGWNSDKKLDELKRSLEVIRNTSTEIIDAIQPPAKKKKKEHGAVPKKRKPAKAYPRR